MAEWGYAKFRWKGGRAAWVVRSAIADGLERAGEHVKRTMRRLLNVPYPPASRPGESPHKRSGNLRDSISVWVNRKTLTVWIGPSDEAVYGMFLEFGEGLDPRPFMFKAIEQEKTKLTNTVNRAAAIAFKKYAA